MIFIYAFMVLVNKAQAEMSSSPLPLPMPLPVPLEVIEQIKKDFGIKDTSDKVFVRQKQVVLIKADQKENKFTFSENKTQQDFSHLGFKTKTYQVRFVANEKKEVPPATSGGGGEHEAPSKGHGEEEAKGGHGGPPPSGGEHDAPKAEAHGGESSGGHEAPAGEHGAPAHGEEAKGGHGSPSSGGGHGGSGASAPSTPKTVYFINRYQEQKVGDHTFGTPCGTAFKIQGQIDQLFGEEGLKAESIGGRHLDLFGGDFIIVEPEGPNNLNVSLVSLRDSRYASRICREIPKREKKDAEHGSEHGEKKEGGEHGHH